MAVGLKMSQVCKASMDGLANSLGDSCLLQTMAWLKTGSKCATLSCTKKNLEKQATQH
jgi:hypothetical protein